MSKINNSKVKVKQKEENNILDVEIKKQKKQSNNSSLINDILQGSLLGFGGIAYGSSASLISNWYSNSYSNIIVRLTKLFKKSSFSDYFKNLLSLTGFILSSLVIFIISYVIYVEMSKAGYAIAASFLFIGLNIFSIPMLYLIKQLRPKLAINSQQFSSFERPKINWIIFGILFFVIFGISFIARYAWVSNDTFPSGLITSGQFESYVSPIANNVVSSVYSNSNLETSYILQILFGTFLCGFATFIPGLSGSFLLNVVGVNTDINIAVQYGFGNYSSGIEMISSDWAWPVIVISFIGVITGVIASIFTMNYLINNQKEILNTSIFAISIASFIGVLISFNEVQYKVLSNDHSLLGTSIALFFVSIIPVCGTILYFQKVHKINLKFLSFIK